MVNPVLLTQLPYMGVDIWCSIIEEEVLGNAKPANDTILNETSHNSSTISLESHYVNAFGIAPRKWSISDLEMVDLWD